MTVVMLWNVRGSLACRRLLIFVAMNTYDIKQRAERIKLVLADVDGVLTDGGVYYGAEGEVMKRFNIRDGMGVERLRDCGAEVGLITGEASPSVSRRAEKLKIKRVYLEAKEKKRAVEEIARDAKMDLSEIAFIGDDVNDLEAMKIVGLAAAPSDAFVGVREIAHYVCATRGGNGAFREFAEFLIESRQVETDQVGAQVGFGL